MLEDKQSHFMYKRTDIKWTVLSAGAQQSHRIIVHGSNIYQFVHRETWTEAPTDLPLVWWRYSNNVLNRWTNHESALHVFM